MGVKLYCPENLDLNALLVANPKRGIKKDHLLYIVNTIIFLRSIYDDERLMKLGKASGFVPLNTKVLETMNCRNRELQYLIEHGVIVSDNSYVSESICTIRKPAVSIGYKLSETYYGQQYKREEITDFILLKNIKKQKTHYSDGKNYLHLQKWFKTGKLEIDYLAANRLINTWEEDELKEIENSNDASNRLPRKLEVHNKHNIFKILVSRIAENDFYHTADSKGKRYHTNLTNLPKELRKYINYDGKTLVSIDIKNSQPYMSLLLLNKRFWKKEKETDFPTLYKQDRERYKKIEKHNNNLSNIIMFADSPKTLTGKDIQTKKFFEHVINGTFYDYLIKVFEDEYGMNLGNDYEEKRSRVKKLVLTLLFDHDNKPYNRKSDSPMNLFKRKFPNVARVFGFIKESGYQNLAIILQRIESHLLLDKVCGRISKEKPQMPIFTIHDSIITTVGNEDYVKSVMANELQKVIGAPPKLSVEYWEEQTSQVQLKAA